MSVLSHVTRHFYYRSNVINGMLKFIECGIDLVRIKIDKAQRILRKTQFSTARKFQQRRNLTREMIRHANDLRLFVDQFLVRKNRHRLFGYPDERSPSEHAETLDCLPHGLRGPDQFE